MGMTPQQFYTIPTSCAVCQLWFVFVTCGHRKEVEGSGVCSAGRVVLVDVHGE